MHAFDDEGINYNFEGVLAPLYDNTTIQAFHKDADCLREQYSKYKISGGLPVTTLEYI